MRGCWEPGSERPFTAAPAENADAARVTTAPGNWEPAVRLRDFVPVELRRDHRIVVVVTDPDARRDERTPERLAVSAPPPEGEQGGLTLFGEPEG